MAGKKLQKRRCKNYYTIDIKSAHLQKDYFIIYTYSASALVDKVTEIHIFRNFALQNCCAPQLCFPSRPLQILLRLNKL